MQKEIKLTLESYREDVQREWDRLQRDPYHKLEFDTTLRFLKKYLPKKGKILDAGGGPGRYSVELARQGYDVTLLDLVPEHIEFAKNKIEESKVSNKIKDALVGTITDLSRFEDNSFDAVLCLGGPLSHVHPESDRKKAVKELVRVAKTNAPIFVSVMGKLGTLTKFHKWINELKDTKHFREFYEKGDDYQWNKGRSFAHFFELKELKSLFEEKVEFLEDVGLEGLATPSAESFNDLAEKEPKALRNWMEMHYKTCTNPSVVDTSVHLMVIGRKK
jgi:ubiquinone/menaquinone biosynthesis C-methylase UbiE